MGTVGSSGLLPMAKVTGSGCVFSNPVQCVLASHMEVDERAMATEQNRMQEVKGQAILF